MDIYSWYVNFNNYNPFCWKFLLVKRIIEIYYKFILKRHLFWDVFFYKLVRVRRFELPTCRLGGDRSIQLSYTLILFEVLSGCLHTSKTEINISWYIYGCFIEFRKAWVLFGCNLGFDCWCKWVKMPCFRAV